MYGFYISLGCRFAFRMQNLPYEKILGNFFDFIDFGHQVRVCETRSVFNISCISKCMRYTYIWVAYLNSEHKNYPMKEFRATFFNFIDFGHQVCVYETMSFLNNSCISKCMGFT